MRTLQDLQQQLPTSAENGLTPEAVVLSRQRFGLNRLTPLPREPLWKKFLDKFDEPIIKILLAAALLSMVVDLFAASKTGQSETGRYVAAGIAVGLVAAALAAAYALGRREWVPSILFLSALVLWPVGLAT